MSDEIENVSVFEPNQARNNYTVDEIADKIVELAIKKMLAKLKAANKQGDGDE